MCHELCFEFVFVAPVELASLAPRLEHSSLFGLHLLSFKVQNDVQIFLIFQHCRLILIKKYNNSVWKNILVAKLNW